MPFDATLRPHADLVPDALAESRVLIGVDEIDPLLTLVRAASAGQRDALVRLLSLVTPAISATVRVFLRNEPIEMEDAVQEVLLAVTESLPRFRGDSSFLHYCRRIAVRVALAHRRANRRRTEIAAAPPEAPGESEGSGGAADGIAREQLVSAFRLLLEELPQAQAESLAYRVVLEYPLPVIARETGVSINTVRSRIRLARDYLRDRISNDPALAELMKDTK
jgi:RNA polymerase sigma-70 factor (ECF subfamily)